MRPCQSRRSVHHPAPRRPPGAHRDDTMDTDWLLSLAHDLQAASGPSAALHHLTNRPLLAAGLFVRLVAAVWVGALPLGREAPARVRLVLAGMLAVVALPTAALTSGAGLATATPVTLLVSEGIVGLGLGLFAACIVTSAAWAGAMVGSVSGLSWADDFAVDAAEDSAGTARLAWWCGAAAFFAAGGHLTVIVGLLDTTATIPVGSVVAGTVGTTPLLDVITAAPGLGLSLAMAVATPTLAALVTFHAAAALCLRTVTFAPGGGLLQGAAALVAIGALVIGSDAWLGGFAAAAGDVIERGLAAAGAGR